MLLNHNYLLQLKLVWNPNIEMHFAYCRSLFAGVDWVWSPTSFTTVFVMAVYTILLPVS